jgi:uncharacterized protein (DUF58 family)
MAKVTSNSKPRPKKLIGPIFGTLPLMFALIGVARASGSGWVQFIGAIISSSILIGILTPMVILLRTKIKLVFLPNYLIANTENLIEIYSNKTVRITIEQSQPAFIRSRSSQHIHYFPKHKGSVNSIALMVSTAAPLGIVWWYKKVTINLDSPLLIIPPPGRPNFAISIAHSDLEQQWQNSVTGLIRGTKDYFVGDSLRNANWKATAHTGKLQIKEFEFPKSDTFTLNAFFPEDDDSAEQMAEAIVGTIFELLKNHSGLIILNTLNNNKINSCQITSLLQAQIQLAQADSINQH